jgi:hypothetical protein
LLFPFDDPRDWIIPLQHVIDRVLASLFRVADTFGLKRVGIYGGAGGSRTPGLTFRKTNVQIGVETFGLYYIYQQLTTWVS